MPTRALTSSPSGQQFQRTGTPAIGPGRKGGRVSREGTLKGSKRPGPRAKLTLAGVAVASANGVAGPEADPSNLDQGFRSLMLVPVLDVSQTPPTVIAVFQVGAACTAGLLDESVTHA